MGLGCGQKSYGFEAIVSGSLMALQESAGADLQESRSILLEAAGQGSLLCSRGKFTTFSLEVMWTIENGPD